MNAHRADFLLAEPGAAVLGMSGRSEAVVGASADHRLLERRDVLSHVAALRGIDDGTGPASVVLVNPDALRRQPIARGYDVAMFSAATEGENRRMLDEEELVLASTLHFIGGLAHERQPIFVLDATELPGGELTHGE